MALRTKNPNKVCGVCQKQFNDSKVYPASLVRNAISSLIAIDHPAWNADSFICHNDLNHYRSVYVQSVLTQEKGELSHLEKEVLDSLKEHQVIAENLNDTTQENESLGGMCQ